MNVFKAILGVILSAVLFVVMSIALFYITIGLGYLFGLLIVALPFLSGWLTTALPITAEQIPSIVALMSLAGMFIGVTGGVKATKRFGQKGE